MTEKKHLGWHVLSGDGHLAYNMKRRRARVGVTYSVKGIIRCCKNGLHASPTLRDAVNCYFRAHDVRVEPDYVVTRVEVFGDIHVNHDSPKYYRKFCGRNRTVLKMWKVSGATLFDIADGTIRFNPRTAKEFK